MKKTAIIILALALSLALSACKIPIGYRAETKTDKAQQPSSDTVQKAQDVPSANPDASQNASLQTEQNQTKVADEAPKQESSAPAQTPKAAESNIISRDSAIGIALKDAGLARDSVYDLNAELDKEMYGTFWEVDFETREKEYSYDIDALTGKIFYQERERND